MMGYELYIGRTITAADDVHGQQKVPKRAYSKRECDAII
jgi:hypothetical protein